MTDSALFSWLLLHRLPLGATAVRRLAAPADDACEPAGDAAQWLRLDGSALARRGVPARGRAAIAGWQRQGSRHPAHIQAARDQAWLVGESASLLWLTHPDYPALLREIADPPPWLYVRGDPASLALPQLAVVGSRHPTHGGLENARHFAGALAAAGFAITSGLAYGIDAAAHLAALAAGGSTVAVLGSGLDRIYPARHAELAAAVLQQGALVSELPLGTPPYAGNFPRRNRIISGLSLGVLVVEAALQSGSLVTARLALEQNREVYALPGSIHSPASRGCNALIRQGATLVQDLDDIRQELGGWVFGATVAPTDERRPRLSLAGLGLSESAVLAAVGFEPTDLDLIVERTGLAVPQVMAAMAELELAGAIEVTGGGWLRCPADTA